MATHSCILAWEIPWQRGLVGYSPWGHKESDATEYTRAIEQKTSELVACKESEHVS